MAEKMKEQSGGKRDLTGKRFGKLTVIENTGMTEQKYRIWRCRCDCGGEIMASTKQLKSGVIRDCGCVPKTNARNGRVAEDLTGQRFGRLTALRPTERRDRKGSVYWCREMYLAAVV